MGNLIRLFFLFYIIYLTQVYASSWSKNYSIGSSTLDNAAVFQVDSLTKGVLLSPRLTTGQIDEFPSTVESLQVYDTTLSRQKQYIGSWQEFVYADLSATLLNKTIGDGLIFSPVSNPAHQEGLLFYDTDEKSLAYYNDDTNLKVNVGLEQYVYVRNQTGSTITKGQIVRVSNSASNIPQIVLAQADSVSNSSVIGIAVYNLTNNTNGYVMTGGTAHNLNTSSFSEGDLLYLSATTPGAMTTTQPTVPYRSVLIGRVTNSHITQGKILVKITEQAVSGFTQFYIPFADSNGDLTQSSLLKFDSDESTLKVDGTISILNENELRLYGSGTGYASFKAPAGVTGTDYIIPASDGSSGQVLATDGSGNLSWQDGGSSLTFDDEQIIFGSGSGTGIGSSKLVWNYSSSILEVTGKISIKTEQSLCLEDNSGGEAMCLKSPSSLGGTTTLILPNGDGTSGQVLSTNGTGQLSWTSNTTNPFTTITVSTTPKTLASTGEENVIVDTTSGNITLNLPAAASNNGVVYRITKKSSDSNHIIIDGNSSETIDGDTTLDLYGQYNSVVIACDGSNWQVVAGPIPQTCVFTDEKSSGTNGGTFTSGSYQTRTLNTQSGSCDWVTNSGSGTLALVKGQYTAEGTAPAYRVDQHKTRLRNTSDSTDVKIGTSAYSDADNTSPANRGFTYSHVSAKFTLTTTKNIELQHRCSTTGTTTGFGTATTYSDVEVYSKLILTKVK